MTDWDVMLRGGRVIDPESGLDAVRDVAVNGDRVVEIASVGPGVARDECDVTGLVVTAGFVDVHSHVNEVAGLWLQAMDGVTTALELEAGAAPVATAYRAAAAQGRPVNYGFATSWAQARMQAVAGIAPDGTLGGIMGNLADPSWQRAASGAELAAMFDALAADLADGALGIGVLLGYAPESRPAEYLRVAALAAQAGVPTFTHARDLIELVPGTAIDGAEEIVRAAGQTGAAMHYCHINSTSLRHIDRVLSVVARAQAAGARVSTEAYPYGAGMTGIGAAFLAPERLGERGMVPSSLTYAATGERVADEARLRELRATDPGGLVIMEMLDESDPADRELLMRSLSFPGGIVASDAMPVTWIGGGSPALRWPLSGGAFTHPRTAGTFCRAMRVLTRDGGGFGLSAALARCSLEPARLLEEGVPAMRRKGRVGVGCDADLVVFDPEVISDRAGYGSSTRPSAGIRHVLVNGTFVVRDGEIVTDVRPGRAVRRLSGSLRRWPGGMWTRT
jgi:N-acyl-D-aspartate/D-glutamate deacylase